MFDNIKKIISKVKNNQNILDGKSKDAAKERLHLVLMQDRANVSADFLDLMKQEIIDVIKKYIEVDEKSIDVRLTNKANTDGTTGSPALYANIPIVGLKNEIRKNADTPIIEKVKQTEEIKIEFANANIFDEINKEIEFNTTNIDLENIQTIEKEKNKEAENEESEKEEVATTKKATATKKTTTKKATTKKATATKTNKETNTKK